MLSGTAPSKHQHCDTKCTLRWGRDQETSRDDLEPFGLLFAVAFALGLDLGLHLALAVRLLLSCDEGQVQSNTGVSLKS